LAYELYTYIHTYIQELSKSFRTGRLKRELQMVELSSPRCSFIAILWVSLVSFAAITLYVASQRVISKVSLYFAIDSVRKLLDTIYMFTFTMDVIWYENSKVPHGHIHIAMEATQTCSKQITYKDETSLHMWVWNRK